MPEGKARRAAVARAIARDLLGVAGGAMIIGGLAMLSLAAALIFGGALTIGLTVLWARSG